MATIMYDGKQIAGGGVSVVHMTEQQYLQNKTALDASDLLIEITDKDYPVEADNIGFTPPTGMNATNVQDAIEEVNEKACIVKNKSLTFNSSGYCDIPNTDSDFIYDNWLIPPVQDSNGNCLLFFPYKYSPFVRIYGKFIDSNGMTIALTETTIIVPIILN